MVQKKTNSVDQLFGGDGIAIQNSVERRRQVLIDLDQFGVGVWSVFDHLHHSFVRSLEAYRKSIDEGTTLVLSPESEFFDYFRSSAGAGAP